MRRTLALLWTAGLFAATLVPGEFVPNVPVLSFDKLVHVVMFAGFALLWLALYPRRRGAVVVGGLAVGLAIEVLQEVLPIHRSGEASDLLADAVGLALALGAHALWARRGATGRPAGP